MKKRLLIYSTFLFVVFGMKNVNAQTFDLDFKNYFHNNAASFNNRTNAKDAFNWWKGASDRFVTQGTIKASVLNRPNSINAGNEPDDTNPLYLRARFDHDLADIIIESENELATIGLQYKGATDAGEGAFQVSYGASAAGPLAVRVLDVVVGAAPGSGVFFNFPKNLAQKTNVKYVKIQRAPGKQSTLYRVTTSSTVFTAFPTLPPLPVKLTNFTASLSKSGVLKADWKTASETKNSHFILQSSVDGNSWKDLVRKDADPNGATGATYQVETYIGGFSLAGFGLLSILLLPFSNKRYRILTMLALIGIVAVSCAKDSDISNAELLDKDNENSKDVIYLRLAQVDLDGTTEYSEIIPVKAK